MKRKGFVLLEVVVSTVIVLSMAYVVGFSINNSLRLLSKNEDYIHMVNLAQNYMEEAKSKVSYDENFKEGVFDLAKDGFNIKTIITKNEGYLDNYKINVSISKSDRRIDLEGYVTKK